MATISEAVEKAGRLVRHALGAAMSPIRAGDEKIASHQKSLSAPASLQVWSDSFGAGQPIPVNYTPAGANLSPAIAWSNVPAETQELVLICEDPDAPMSKPFVHWILHHLKPDRTSLPEGVRNQREVPQLGGAIQSQNDNKTWGWFGPRPPLGHGVHHYHFQLFALDQTLNLGADATLEQLVKAMHGHVLAEGEVVGTHELKGTT